MKKLYISLAMMLVASIGFAQFAAPEFQVNSKLKVGPEFKAPKEKAGTDNIYVSYYFAESDIYGDEFITTGALTNINYTVEDRVNNEEMYYIQNAVVFNTILDLNTGEDVNTGKEYPKTNIQSMKIDSIDVPLWHKRESATSNSFTIRVISTDQYGNPENTVLAEKTITIDSSYAEEFTGVMTFKFDAPVNISAPYNFGVLFEFDGEKTLDSCWLMFGFGIGTYCNGDPNDARAAQSIYYPNSFQRYGWVYDEENAVDYSQYFFPYVDETGEASDILYYPCGEDQYPFIIQNYAISTWMTIDHNVGIQEKATNITSMSQNMPNPANGMTAISYNLVNNADVIFNVVDLTGRTVYTENLVNVNAGANTVEFDASQLQKGIYFYSIEANGAKLTKKMIVQ